MAYMVEITPPRCQSCGGGAKQTVFNSRNARVGEFCNPCAKRKVKELDAADSGGEADGRERRG